jgi:hypothetical protein
LIPPAQHDSSAIERVLEAATRYTEGPDIYVRRGTLLFYLDIQVFAAFQDLDFNTIRNAMNQNIIHGRSHLQIFQRNRFNERNDSGQKVLVLFSDMRYSMLDLNLESPSRVPSLSDVRKQAHIIPAHLQRVRVYAMGVDGAGKDLTYWERLRQFWSEYLHTCGSTLESYTVLRDSTRAIAPLETSHVNSQ